MKAISENPTSLFKMEIRLAYPKRIICEDTKNS